jgi:hypothetical protein
MCHEYRHSSLPGQRFNFRLAGAVGIIELEDAFAGLTTVTLLTTFTITLNHPLILKIYL